MVKNVCATTSRFFELQSNFFHSDGIGKTTIKPIEARTRRALTADPMNLNGPATGLVQALESRTAAAADRTEEAGALAPTAELEPACNPGTRAKASWLCALTGFLGIASGFALFVQVSTEIGHGGHFFLR